jgi:hypothetical protein
MELKFIEVLSSFQHSVCLIGVDEMCVGCYLNGVFQIQIRHLTFLTARCNIKLFFLEICLWNMSQ